MAKGWWCRSVSGRRWRSQFATAARAGAVKRSTGSHATVLRFAGIWCGSMRGPSRPSPTAGAAHLWRITPRRFTAIEEQPDLTLDEIVAVTRKREIPGSRTALFRFWSVTPSR